MIWDVNTGERVHALNSSDWMLNSISYSHDGRRLAGGGQRGTIDLWDIQSKTKLLGLKGHQIGQPICAITFSPDGTRLASGSWDKSIRIWDTSTGKTLYSQQNLNGIVQTLAFSPDGSKFAFSDGSRIQFLNTKSSGEVAQERTQARNRVAQLSPLVDSWIENSKGDTELVLAELDSELKNRTSREISTLRNLVLKKLVEFRQSSISTEPTTP